MAIDNILSLEEAAGRLGIHVRSLQRLLADSSGPPTIQLTSRRIGILESDLSNWIASRRRDKRHKAA